VIEPPVAAAPPAPTITVYVAEGFKLNVGSADAPPPLVPVDVLNPPAPPPEFEPEPPPATTKKLALIVEPEVQPKAASAAAPILDKRGIYKPLSKFSD
jgi:hypothetical protein